MVQIDFPMSQAFNLSRDTVVLISAESRPHAGMWDATTAAWNTRAAGGMVSPAAELLETTRETQNFSILAPFQDKVGS